MIRTSESWRFASRISFIHWFKANSRRRLRYAATLFVLFLLAAELRRAVMLWHQPSTPIVRLICAALLLLCGASLMLWAIWTKGEL